MQHEIFEGEIVQILPRCAHAAGVVMVVAVVEGESVWGYITTPQGTLGQVNESLIFVIEVNAADLLVVGRCMYLTPIAIEKVKLIVQERKQQHAAPN